MRFLMSDVRLSTANRRSVAVTFLNCRSYDLHYYRSSIGRSPATFRKTLLKTISIDGKSLEDFTAIDSNRPFSPIFGEMLDLANNEYQKTLHEVVFTT